MDDHGAGKEDSPSKQDCRPPAGGPTLSGIALFFGISANFAQYLSVKIDNLIVLAAASAVLTVTLVVVVLLVRRMRKVPVSSAVVIAVLAALGGAGIGYIIWGDGDDKAAAGGDRNGSAAASPSTVPTSPLSSGPASPSSGPSPTTAPATTISPPAPTRPVPGPGATTTTTACGTAVISFSKPARNAARIAPGTDVEFQGSVRCLAAGNVLWLVSQTADAGSLFYTTPGDPVATTAGEWAATVFKLGDDSDAGKWRTFFGVEADPACSSALSAVKDNRPRTLPALPPTCRRLTPTMTVRFK